MMLMASGKGKQIFKQETNKEGLWKRGNTEQF